MFLILYGFHDSSLNKLAMLFLIPFSIVTSLYGHFISRIASEFINTYISLLKIIYFSI
jgi:hypothetical protein